MFRVYAFDNNGRECTGPASLLVDLAEARLRAAAFERQGLLARIYAQRSNDRGDIVETLVE